MKKKKTIEDLENDFWQSPPSFPTEMVKNVFALRKKPLDEFTPNDIRLLLSQNVGLKYIIPNAIELLKENPLKEALYYPGDLLSSILNVVEEYWKANHLQMEEVRLILKKIKPSLISIEGENEINVELMRSVDKFISQHKEMEN